ncbi:hypothetical protein DITRI_Ditri19aG0126100 [Diplodiscus trichospermus]
MSSQRTAHDISQNAGEATQAQLKRGEIMNQASTDSQSSDQNSSYASQATNFLQQTGEQVKHMAQGAADAVKNTLGMNNADDASNASNPNPITNHPGNPSPRT